jgi:outer membrane protein, adhesin transport system
MKYFFNKKYILAFGMVISAPFCFAGLIEEKLLDFSSNPAQSDRSLSESKSLEGLIQQALDTYPTILANRAMRDAASSDIDGAKLKFLPNISLNHQQGRINYSDQTSNQQTTKTLTISQPLYQGGALIAGYRKSVAKYNAADNAFQEAKKEVTLKIISTYGEWLRAMLKIQAFQTNIEVHQKLVDMITRRAAEGVASRVDVDLSQARLMMAKADMVTQQAMADTALSSLSQLSGLKLSRGELLRAMPIKPPNRDEAFEIAVANSVGIRRYTFEAQAAEEEAKEIKSQVLPQIALQAQSQIGNMATPTSPNYNMVGFVINYASGNGFSTLAASQSAIERAKASRLQIETTKRELIDKLTMDFNEYDQSVLKRESLLLSEKYSSEIIESYDRQYIVGRKSWLDLMNMVRELVQNRVALADVEVSALVSSRRISVYLDAPDSLELTADYFN